MPMAAFAGFHTVGSDPLHRQLLSVVWRGFPVRCILWIHTVTAQHCLRDAEHHSDDRLYVSPISDLHSDDHDRRSFCRPTDESDLSAAIFADTGDLSAHFCRLLSGNLCESMGAEADHQKFFLVVLLHIVVMICKPAGCSG